MKKCTILHIDQNLGGCGTKGARTCCKDCPAKPCCVTVCTKAYEAGVCKYEEIDLRELWQELGANTK